MPLPSKAASLYLPELSLATSVPPIVASVAVHPPDLVPDHKNWSPHECRCFKWLIGDAERWGSWQTCVRLLMDFRCCAGFPVYFNTDQFL